MQPQKDRLKEFQTLQELIKRQVNQDKNFDEIIKLYNEAESLKANIEILQKDNNSTIENIEKKLINEMKLQNMESLEHEGVRYSWALKKFFSVLEKDKDKFFKWLEEIGYGDLIKIKKDVHYQTLNGFFRNEYKGELPAIINVHKSDVLSKRKKNNK